MTCHMYPLDLHSAQIARLMLMNWHAHLPVALRQPRYLMAHRCYTEPCPVLLLSRVCLCFAPIALTWLLMWSMRCMRLMFAHCP